MSAVQARLRVPDDLLPAFEQAGREPGVVEEGLVFAARHVGDGWPEVLAELTEAFELSRQAASAGAPVVYVVHNDDLLGRRGPGRAMVATGLVSGARTLAFEGRKAGTPANVLVVEDGSPPEQIARWAVRLLERDGPSGELVHLGSMHVGKALP